MPEAKNRRDQGAYTRTNIVLSDPDWPIVMSYLYISPWSELLLKD